MIRALAASTVAASLLVVAPAAHAEDKRPCVSKAEAKVHHHGDQRAAVEQEWDVRNLGGQGTMSTLIDPGFNAYIIDYRACGYNDTEAGVSVFYREDDNTVKFVMQWWSDTATPHGNP